MNALDQAWGVLKEEDGVPFSDLSDEELADSIERTGRGSAGMLHGHLMMLAYQRMKERDPVGRAGIISQMERALNEQRKKQGETPFIVAPRKIPQEVIGEGLDFPPNFNRRKLASADAFTSAWDVVKAVLPDLPHDTLLERFKGFNPFERDAITYQLSLEPEIARRVLNDNYGFYMREEDPLKYPTQIDAWKRELEQNPVLFRFPQHIMSRLSGRHSRDQSMSMGDFRNLAMARGVVGDYSDGETMMTRYIDEMERRGEPVIIGNAQITPATQNMHTITMNPGFDGKGYARHLLGAMIQEQGGVNDNQFSREGYNLFRNMGNLLTQGGEQSIVPFIESGAEVDDFAQKYYTNRGLVDSILGDVRFTQPYGQNLSDGGDGYYYMSDGELVYNPPPFYPIEFSKPRGRGVNPNVKGRNPFEIVYTGDDPAFITNLGVD